jgi:hypothetical protein
MYRIKVKKGFFDLFRGPRSTSFKKPSRVYAQVKSALCRILQLCIAHVGCKKNFGQCYKIIYSGTEGRAFEPRQENQSNVVVGVYGTAAKCRATFCRGTVYIYSVCYWL